MEDYTARATAHVRWAERYNKTGNPKKAVAHFGRALDGHASCRNGERGAYVHPRAARRSGDVQAGLRRVTEAPTVMGIDQRIGAKQPE